MAITFDKEYLKGFVEEKDFKKLLPEIKKAHLQLEKKTGLGSDFTGWVDLPSRIKDSEIS